MFTNKNWTRSKPRQYQKIKRFSQIRSYSTRLSAIRCIKACPPVPSSETGRHNKPTMRPLQDLSSMHEQQGPIPWVSGLKVKCSVLPPTRLALWQLWHKVCPYLVRHSEIIWAQERREWNRIRTLLRSKI